MLNKQDINTALMTMLGSMELVDKWWVSPNKSFELKTPETVYKTDPQKVLQYVLNHYYR